MGRRGARMRDRGESSMGSQMVVGRTEEAARKAGRKEGGKEGAKKSLKLLGNPCIINITYERWRRQQQGGDGAGGRLGKGVEQNRN